LLIGGRQDGIMDAAYLQDFARGIAGARLVMVDSGHMLPQEATAEVLREMTGAARTA
jgi:pimeloyl-ACP methyl ester carboxylesterase